MKLLTLINISTRKKKKQKERKATATDLSLTYTKNGLDKPEYLNKPPFPLLFA
jgi:hypothetical protein